jgi:hypothetical protein
LEKNVPETEKRETETLWGGDRFGTVSITEEKSAKGLSGAACRQSTEKTARPLILQKNSTIPAGFAPFLTQRYPRNNQNLRLSRTTRTTMVSPVPCVTSAT